MSTISDSNEGEWQDRESDFSFHESLLDEILGEEVENENEISVETDVDNTVVIDLTDDGDDCGDTDNAVYYCDLTSGTPVYYDVVTV